jgi:hypothetical protein
MAFSITEFNSHINKHGVSKQNIFVVTITLPPKLSSIENYIPTRDLTFLCRQVTLPGFDVNAPMIYPQSLGVGERRAIGINDFEVVPMVFMMDSNFNVLKFFHRWMQSVVNYDTKAGYNSQLPGTTQAVYQVGYKKDYAATITIEVYSGNSPFGGKYTYVLKNAYPVNIGSVLENWEDTNTIMTLNVGISFDGLDVDGTTRGEVSSNPFNMEMGQRKLSGCSEARILVERKGPLAYL